MKVPLKPQAFGHEYLFLHTSFQHHFEMNTKSRTDPFLLCMCKYTHNKLLFNKLIVLSFYVLFLIIAIFVLHINEGRHLACMHHPVRKFSKCCYE